MALEPFDFAVIDFANEIGVESEVVYRWCDDLPEYKNKGYRDRCAEAELFAFLEKVKERHSQQNQ